ncbi:hypothetical protein ACFQ0K_14985 [Nocardioides caeni]|uniref:Uncharacterized protein n=1 Tax=Nocardioides caeni TaxID=574700 RepID=A0A4S8NHR9_9ACTN|nr:hypothetical protein [Nocardioides caeni]THV14669.1 hypothetical protein E9934_08395 [Nocardioides caeni]
MTGYDDLSSLIPRIAEAAIDWRMQTMGWGTRNGSGGWTIIGLASHWQCDNDGTTYNNGERTEDTYFRDLFADWRATVPEVLEPWTELPDPAWLGWRVDALRTQANSLLDPSALDADDLDPGASGVPVLGNGDLHSARETIDAKIGAMEGYTATQMYDVLVTKTDDVIRGEFAATGVLGQHLAGQASILEKARTDVAALFDACFEVMDKKGLVGGGSIDLAIPRALITAVGVFATGGLSTAISAIGAAVGLADALIPEGAEPNPIEVSLAGYDEHESWTLMTEALTSLNTSITEQEDDLATRSGRATTLISGSPAFDLSRITGAGSDPAALADAGDVVAIDRGGLRYVAEVSIPGATTSLDRTAYAIEDIEPKHSMSRPATIGRASDGIHAEWSQLRDATVACVRGTANELWSLRGGVIEVLHDFGVVDVEQAERYRPPEPSPNTLLRGPQLAI